MRPEGKDIVGVSAAGEPGISGVSESGIFGADEPGRRGVLCAAALLGAGALAGCATRDGGMSGATPPKLKGKPLAKAADVPVGGGRVDGNLKVVVTQPEQGTYKAFSAVCTHQGGTLGTIEDGVITCPLHGSEFSVTDGSVKKGPARAPLKSYPCKLQGDNIVGA